MNICLCDNYDAVCGSHFELVILNLKIGIENDD